MAKSAAKPPNPDIPYGLCQCGCGRKTELAIITRPGRFQVKGEPLRFIWGHQARTTPAPPDGFKHCLTCREVKPNADFAGLKMAKDGLQSNCRECSRKSVLKWRDRHPGKPQEYSANLRRRREFGIEPEQYAELMQAQGGVCAICGQHNQRKNKDGSHYALTVDHCHTSTAIRGLLCNKCNPLLGYANDDIAILEAAIAYLKRHCP